MNLEEMVTSGVQKSAMITTIAGIEGVGKTTLAGTLKENTLVIDLENGSKFLDVKRITKEHLPTYKKFYSFLESLSKDCPFEAIVIDSATRAVDMMRVAVLEEYKVTSLNKISYGGGTIAMEERTEDLMNLLIKIKELGVEVFIIAHTKIKTFNDPKGETYDRYTLSMPDRCSNKIKELSDNVLHATYKYFKKDEKTAISNGERVLYTEWRPSFDAKNRIGLPFEIPLSEYKTVLESNKPKTASELETEIKDMILNIKDAALLEKINHSLNEASGVEQYKQIKNRVAELTKTIVQ